ncbi:hypothetical protein KCU62_g2233, partial [Aureobasidium sp. EXF-3399]
MEAIPKVIEAFVTAVFKHAQSSQHCKNVETDYENMLPRHKDFPALEIQKTTRLNQARKDLETTEAQTAEATALLLDAFKAHFQPGPAPHQHQDCVSRSEFNRLKDQFRANRADAHEMEQLREQNNEMNKALMRVENDLDREMRANKRLENRLDDLENISRRTTKTIDATCGKYKSLEDLTAKDRLSFRTRCSALETEIDKSKTRHKAFDDYVYKSKASHEEHTQSLELYRQKVESLQQELKDQAVHPSVSPALHPPDPFLGNIESRLKAAEHSVAELKEDAKGEDSLIFEQLDELRTDLDKMHAKLNELQTAVDEVKRATLERVPEDLKPQLDYISRTVETHIDLLQRHEVRLNSVTTDELYRQMDSQFRQAYGVPNELRGIVQRQSKVEAICKTHHESFNNIHTRIEAMATELRGSKYIRS